MVQRAEQAGVRLLALTDHDTVDGVDEALQAARTVKIVPAVELSSVHNDYEDLHILGYGLDHTDPQLLATLEDFRGDRVRRIEAMADNLRAEGFTIELPEHKAPGPPTSREGAAGRRRSCRTNEIFAKYLVPGTPTYVGRSRPTVQQAIDVIHAPAASPSGRTPTGTWTRRWPRCDQFAGYGIDGVEAFYATHNEAQTRALHAAARERGPADHRLRGLPRARA